MSAKRKFKAGGHSPPLQCFRLIFPCLVFSSRSSFFLSLLNRPIVRRPKTKYRVHHLCADKAYDSEPLREKLRQRNFKPHIRKREYDSDPPPKPLEAQKHPARRWVVERTISWQNDFRSLRIRWAKKSSNWLALIYFACTLILWRMCSQA